MDPPSVPGLLSQDRAAAQPFPHGLIFGSEKPRWPLGCSRYLAVTLETCTGQNLRNMHIVGIQKGFKIFIHYLFCVRAGVPVRVYAHHVCAGILGRQRVSDCLELEVLAVSRLGCILQRGFVDGWGYTWLSKVVPRCHSCDCHEVAAS